jgi:hypothetical protein
MGNPESRRAGKDSAGHNDRKHTSSIPGDRDPDVRGREDRARDKNRDEVQPGTGERGKSWQSRSPDPEDKDDQLNQALKDSFPASDPPQPAQPGVTGWDLTEEERKAQDRNKPAA